MASYADVASSGPKQSPEEVGLSDHGRAPAMPQVERTEESVSSLVDVDSPHVSSVPSDYESQSVKTDTQAERLEREAQQKAYNAEAKAKQAKESAKEKAKKEKRTLQENSDNPVIIGNAVVATAIAGVIGFGAYRKYAAGELTWKVAGAWAGFIGLFAAGDYYFSQYLFKHKYPKK
ncbi:hypothetical protein M501DRAFT_1006812 [Patellaria atrata CBS 101060]|uniref:Mitochondrial outer membrane protein OM14 C-terminal domain-containing protein n=1 Tax=Patellaria atrata CBS 101060 TaxID=1346257 RepID=A0A9P4S8U9_9PEZI|nr:hypothetical protein M501DRAFT_1006812 [Patellaria atrata CBS 101060]